MKKIMFILILVSSLWSEEIKIENEYEIYINKTVNIDIKEAKKTEVFFGKFGDFKEKQSEELKELAKNAGVGVVTGLSTAANAVSNSVVNSSGQALAQGAGMGLGIGVVYGAIGLGYFKFKENQHNNFILVNDFENPKGEKTRVLSFFKSADFSDEKIIKEFLIQETNKKI